MSELYDVIVIGAGPAGYPAAIRAAQNKMKVACIDEWKNTDGSYAFGGTCLNAGCIPSKALLESSELYQRAKDEFAVHGIKVGDLQLDLAAMQKRRASVVKTMTGGITALFKANGVTGMQGHGRLLPGNKVLVKGPDGVEKTLQAKHVILASGSVPIRLKNVPHDGKYIVDSWNALEFDAVPARLGVIGAGVIGLELGSVWRRLGSEVTVLEALRAVPADSGSGAIAKEAQRHFKKQGLDIKLGAKVLSAAVAGAAVDVVYSDAQGEHTLQVDKLVVAVGRRPFTQGLLAEGTGVRARRARLHQGRRALPHRRPQRLGGRRCGARPHARAQGQGRGHHGRRPDRRTCYGEVNYKVIPSVIYTAPEIAWVGQTEEQVKAGGRPYKVGTFPFAASGRARAMEAAPGSGENRFRQG